METEIENRPVDNDVIELDPNDFKFDEDNSDVDNTTHPSTDEVDKPVEPEDGVETEHKEETEDYTEFLNNLSKEMKYMDEEIKIESVEELKTLAQKGLNHDKLKEKLSNLESSEEINYIREKAKSLGMTSSEYIQAVKDYEKQQEEQEYEKEYNEMVQSGIAEDIAKKVIESNRKVNELNELQLEMKKEKEEAEKKAKENADYDAFFEKFPDVKVKDIPKEVFVNAQESNLITAYTDYQNQELKKELELLKKNQENKNSSPVTGTTEHGGTKTKETDPFLIGFDSA